jgi:hypothetical protein
MSITSTQDSSSVIPTDSDANSDTGMSGHQNSSARDDSSANEDDYGTKLSKKWIDDFFKKDWKTYYRTYELNEKLYFHYKGKQTYFLVTLCGRLH